MAVKPRPPAHHLKAFRTKIAFGNYQKGAVIKPTGMLRQLWLVRGLIEEIKDEDIASTHETVPRDDRQINTRTLHLRRRDAGQ